MTMTMTTTEFDPYHYGVIGRAIETIAGRTDEQLSLEEVPPASASARRISSGCSRSGQASAPSATSST
jgi:hypothetical protein